MTTLAAETAENPLAVDTEAPAIPVQAQTADAAAPVFENEALPPAAAEPSSGAAAQMDAGAAWAAGKLKAKITAAHLPNQLESNMLSHLQAMDAAYAEIDQADEAALDNIGLPEFMESDQVHVSAFIVQDYSHHHSHWNSRKSLSQWLTEQRVPALYGIDTRALTKRIRDRGAMLARTWTSAASCYARQLDKVIRKDINTKLFESALSEGRNSNRNTLRRLSTFRGSYDNFVYKLGICRSCIGKGDKRSNRRT